MAEYPFLTLTKFSPQFLNTYVTVSGGVVKGGEVPEMAEYPFLTLTKFFFSFF